jgi:hypothetical protein
MFRRSLYNNFSKESILREKNDDLKLSNQMKTISFILVVIFLTPNICLLQGSGVFNGDTYKFKIQIEEEIFQKFGLEKLLLNALFIYVKYIQHSLSKRKLIA